jgi:hypothetical protein
MLDLAQARMDRVPSHRDGIEDRAQIGAVIHHRPPNRNLQRGIDPRRGAVLMWPISLGTKPMLINGDLR